MDSRRARGNAFELASKHALERWGWTVDKARAKVIFIKGRMISGPNDFFGCMDLVGIKRGKKFTLCIQNTLSAGDIAKKKTDVLSVPWDLEAQRVMIWTKDDREGRRGFVRAFRYPDWTEHPFKLSDLEEPYCLSGA